MTTNPQLTNLMIADFIPGLPNWVSIVSLIVGYTLGCIVLSWFRRRPPRR